METAAAEMLKEALVAPDWTETEEGAVREVLVICTTAPPDGAGVFKVTVHAAVPGVTTVVGLHAKAVMMGCDGITVTEPPTPCVGSATASAVVAPGSTIPICAVPAAKPSFTVTMATVPFEIVPWLKPHNRQLYEPALTALHPTALPAAVAAGLADTVMAVISDGEYVNFHCRAVGTEPSGADTVKLRETVPPVGAVPEDKDNEIGVCPLAGKAKKSATARSRKKRRSESVRHTTT